MSSIESFNGGLGSGKTLRMSIKAKDDYENGWKVYANYDFKDKDGNISIPYKKINPNDLINGLFNDELDNAVICMTEAYTFLDSRYSGSESNRYISYFILQTRKRRIKFYYDAQLIGSVDIRARGVTNRIYECHKMVKDRDKDHEDINNIIGFYYNVYEDDGTNYVETLDIEDAIKYFNLYNTKDILLPSYLQPTVDLDNIMEMFSNSPNRETFITLMRIDNPFISLSKCKGIYTLLKNDNIEYVKKILRIS
jgi:hypothetical protein